MDRAPPFETLQALAERSDPPVSILFVCSGNIMRSPLAELMFEQLLDARAPQHWQHFLTIESAGVRYRHDALPTLTADRLIAEGVAPEKLRAFRPRRIHEHPKLFDRADIIIAMTEGHIRQIAKHSQAWAARTYLLTAFGDRPKAPIPDPYFTLRRRRAMEKTARTIRAALGDLFDALLDAGVITATPS